MVLCFYRDVLHIKITETFNIELFVTFLNFDIGSRSNYLVSTITKLRRGILYINISDEFNVDLSFNFVNFKLGQGHLVSMIMLKGMPGSF